MSSTPPTPSNAATKDSQIKAPCTSGSSTPTNTHRENAEQLVLEMVTPASTPHHFKPIEEAKSPSRATARVQREFPPVPGYNDDLTRRLSFDANAGEGDVVSTKEDKEAGWGKHISTAPHSTGLSAYDERLCLHGPPTDMLVKSGGLHSLEGSDRITRTYKGLKKVGLDRACKIIPTRFATRKELLLVHSKTHVNSVELLQNGDKERKRYGKKYEINSVFCNEHTYAAANVSCGTLLNMVEAVMEGTVRNGIAVIRPPGHHADASNAKGFCWYNNVAVAARYAQQSLGVRRILIVDWDMHFGNGIYETFENDPNVLYFSVHRHDHGDFYPQHPCQGSNNVGLYEDSSEAVSGKSVNVAWNHTGLTDADYLAVWRHILLPIAEEFAPELVLVAAGFNGMMNDPIGNCMLTTAGYSQLLHKLMGLADGKVVVSLEGGADPASVAKGVIACTKTLYGVPPISLGVSSNYPSNDAIDAINNTLQAQRKYWKSLARSVDNVASLSLCYKKNRKDSKRNKRKHAETSKREMTPTLMKPQFNKKVNRTPGGFKPATPSCAEKGPNRKVLKAIEDVNSGKRKPMRLKGRVIDPACLYKAVADEGGFDECQYKRCWQSIRKALNLEDSTSSGAQLRKSYEYYFGLV